jgi:L-asparagine oxygenase
MGETKMTLDFGTLERDGFCVASGISGREVLDFVQHHLGPIRVDPRNPEPVRDIRPQTAHVAKSNTLSSRYGVGSFPFHTDTAHWEHPARYLVLFCVSPGEGGRPTLLQDSRSWRFDDAEEDLACQALWAIGHRRPRLSSIAVCSRGQLAIRYDMDCMRPMTADARKSKTLLESRIYARPCERIDWQAGKLLAIDNHRMVHARGEAEQPDPNRVLKRILIGEN